MESQDKSAQTSTRMEGRLAGKVALVTGASRGLGRAIAQAFAAQGAFVFVHYQKGEQEARETLAALQKAGGEGALVCFDVRDAGAVRQSITALQEERPIDILVNNAGICRDQFFMLMEDDDWEDVFAVNVTGMYHCTQAVVHGMLRRRQGVILQVASVAGMHASPGQSNYAASKGALLSFSKTLAAELGPKGIRVNALVPGLLNAGMAARMNQRIARQKKEQIPLRRFGEAEEVARAAVFLASDDASYIVGATLVVDGGLSL